MAKNVIKFEEFTEEFLRNSMFGTFVYRLATQAEGEFEGFKKLIESKSDIEITVSVNGQEVSLKKVVESFQSSLEYMAAHKAEQTTSRLNKMFDKLERNMYQLNKEVERSRSTE